MLRSLRQHWPEYLMEAAGLGIFMVVATVFATVIEHPSSPVRASITDPVFRRTLMGLAMGLTAIGIIYSPWGKQSGAHINPAITLAFFRLGKIKFPDAFFYTVAQFGGGLMGVLLVVAAIGPYLANPSVNFIATIPGPRGPGVAFVAEVAISFGLMLMVLFTSNTPHLARLTGLFAGGLVALYVVIASPFSGFSMNPARTFATALPAWEWTQLWVYFTAPPLGMLLAVEVYLPFQGKRELACPKLHHQNRKRCIFCRKPEGEENSS